MLLRQSSVIEPDVGASLVLPLSVQLAEDLEATLSREDGGAVGMVTLRTIDPSSLSRVEESGWRIDGKLVPAVMVPARNGLGARDLLATLSFLVDQPLRLASNREPELIPENEADHAKLGELGTTRVFIATSVRTRIRTFNPVIDAEAITALLPQIVGVRLYLDALRLNEGVARYRELWRVLESAFQLRDRDLVEALATYAPAKQLGFTELELKDLLILRGRASHAASRGGLLEIDQVNALVEDRLGRLRTLVERVIVTKQTWGVKSGGVHELIGVSAYINSDGNPVLIQPPDH